MKKFLVVPVIACILLLAACNTWPTIIATAEAIADITTVFYPQVGSLSALAVSLLEQAEAAAAAYNANKTTSTEAAYVAAIEAIETQLPADEAALNIPAADQQKVGAAINIILDYVEALAVKAPATRDIVQSARARRKAGNAPPMSKATIVSRWRTQVCEGETRCSGLVR
jgi:hypothetical protein